MSGRKTLARSVLLGGTALLSLVFLLTSARNRPIQQAPQHAFLRPKLDDLPALSACWVEFDRNKVPGQFATAGLTHARTWDLTASGLLVRHPNGTILIDTGSSSHLQQDIAGYPFWSHLYLELLTGGKNPSRSVADVLRANGIDPASLSMVLPSHMHSDHAGGLVDLPNLPVLLSQEEFSFVERNRDTGKIPVVRAYALTIEGRSRILRFQPHSYENFEESVDLFGDGSVVIVKLPGHTPGSLGVFVNLSPQFRIFHVGDAVMVSEAIDRRLSKSLIMRPYENDVPQADKTVAKLSQLHIFDPNLLILPAHDRSAWQRVFGPDPRCVSGLSN